MLPSTFFRLCMKIEEFFKNCFAPLDEPGLIVRSPDFRILYDQPGLGWISGEDVPRHPHSRPQEWQAALRRNIVMTRPPASTLGCLDLPLAGHLR